MQTPKFPFARTRKGNWPWYWKHLGQWLVCYFPLVWQISYIIHPVITESCVFYQNQRGSSCELELACRGLGWPRPEPAATFGEATVPALSEEPATGVGGVHSQAHTVGVRTVVIDKSGFFSKDGLDLSMRKIPNEICNWFIFHLLFNCTNLT